MKNDNWNDYFIPGTNTLKNKLNIKDFDELKNEERKISLSKLVDLHLSPIEGDFDSKHLRKIHKFLFNDIYYFAGEYRNVNITKITKSGFLDYNIIDVELDALLNNIDDKILRFASSDFLYAQSLAQMYHKLIHIHPFREGNGRTIREFLREYVISRNKFFKDYNYELDFSSKKIDYKKLYEGTLAPDGNIGELVLQFLNMLTKKSKENIKIK